MNSQFVEAKDGIENNSSPILEDLSATKKADDSKSSVKKKKSKSKDKVKTKKKQENLPPGWSLPEDYKLETLFPDEENAIEVRNLVVKYRTFKKVSIRKTLFKLKKNEIEYFTAIKGISFDVPKGQILGIIGTNGSGKSTLLRTIAGIYCPDQGSVDIFDNTISLLALGVGFQKKLSGRENILLSGMLLGFSEEYVNSKMDEIIEFADIGDFIDRPVDTYSSGMYSKLAFSITSTLETDILLVDEVLSVGDSRFKKKSYQRMRELIEDKNRTVVIVSHSMKALVELCNNILWIDQGEIVMYGPAQDVIEVYEREN